MENHKDVINISDLPEFAQTEILDFCEVLRTKYKIYPKGAPQRKVGTLSRFVSKPIKVYKIKRYPRDELPER